MTWQLLLAISIAATVFYTLLQKVLIHEKPSEAVAYTIVSQIVPGFLILLYLLVTHGFYMPNLFEFIPNILIMIFFYGFSAVFMFKSLASIDASEFTILFATRALWTLFIAVIFLSEHFSFVQILGTVLLLVSVILVSYKKEKIRLKKGEFLALFSAALFGIALGNDGFLVKYFDIQSYLVFAFMLPGVALMGIYPKEVKKIKIFLDPSLAIKMFLLCIFFAISAITFFSAFKIGNNVGQISILNQISTVLIVLASILYLKERKNIFLKIIGSVIAFIGVVLLR